MPTPLSDKTITIVKATVPALEAHGVEITRRMYERLFRNEAIRDLFNQSHQGETGSQPKALAAAVLAYARNIDNLGALGGAVERIVQKHVALNILPEHYPFVAEALLGAIGDVLGAAATNEILAAWGEAYWFLAEILIGREAAVYRELASQPGGWNGWRDFVVESVADESSIIRSFTLVPADGGKVLRHKPGQYLGFALDIPGVAALRRNYSISCAPNDRAYRITVKREATPGVPAGAASNWLHDHALPGTILRAAAPAGDFFLDTDSSTPVVLVSGGVGLTPMVSMLETIVESQPQRPTWWVHGALNSRVHAMRGHVRNLAAQAPGVSLTTFYAEPLSRDQAGSAYDIQGLVSASWLAQNTPIGDATYYLCGPKPFLHSLIGGLLSQGVPSDRIRYEFFGPADEVLAPDAETLAA
ncbi:MAG: NO-inducible flavohemoprotein [Rhodopila sp.]|nr:NO-inducible flavohemoprotein [Rhodopila sp.]